jgi:hypothetical protein
VPSLDINKQTKRVFANLKIRGVKGKSEENYTKQENEKMQKKMEMPGIEPGAFYMQSKRSITELHPHFI